MENACEHYPPVDADKKMWLFPFHRTRRLELEQVSHALSMIDGNLTSISEYQVRLIDRPTTRSLDIVFDRFIDWLIRALCEYSCV